MSIGLILDIHVAKSCAGWLSQCIVQCHMHCQTQLLPLAFSKLSQAGTMQDRKTILLTGNGYETCSLGTRLQVS